MRAPCRSRAEHFTSRYFKGTPGCMIDSFFVNRSILPQGAVRHCASSTATKNVKKLVSWNVNGLVAATKTSAVQNYVRQESPDILCIQETRLSQPKIKEIEGRIFNTGLYPYEYHTCSLGRKGYSGAAVYSNFKPRGVKVGMGKPEFDSEGRIISLDFDSFYLVCVYVPNAGEGQKRLDFRLKWNDALIEYLQSLSAHKVFTNEGERKDNKGIILCGDMNVAHEEIDIYSPSTLQGASGFTPQERAGFTTLLSELDFVDVYRHANPTSAAYTFWSYRNMAREQDKGWRLDYFLVQRAMMDRVVGPFIRKDARGSDHCPIGLLFNV